MANIVALHILPPLAIARLGSSTSPMDNYSLSVPVAVEARQIVAAETIEVDQTTGESSLKRPPFEAKFRDPAGFIRPIAPFLEVWARREGEDQLVRLTEAMLREAGSTPEKVTWKVQVGNIKAYRRTGDLNDRAEATVMVAGHEKIALLAECKNFLPGKTLPLGWVQYIKPNRELPQIRLRFTPAAGKVYGPPRIPRDKNLADEIYKPDGPWNNFIEPFDLKTSGQVALRRITVPGGIYAGYGDDGGPHIGWGYLDDECDGIVEASIELYGSTLSAYARIAAGPPTFAPDGMPLRTVADEIEQALLGPDIVEPLTEDYLGDVKEILRRAMETVRLMNTQQLNAFSPDRGVGMARMDFLDYNRAGEPLVDPSVADSLAVRARHERALLALESGSLAWFARILRRYDEVGDLTDEGRLKMPAMMRSADGRHLALTRRQVSKVQAAASALQANPKQVSPEEPDFLPVNLAAQLHYLGAGNPPTTHPSSAISNAYPGLEMDFRNIWKHIFVGIELHESNNLVVATAPDHPLLTPLTNAYRLIKVNDQAVTAVVKGPAAKGKSFQDSFGETVLPLEWSNALALVLQAPEPRVQCLFQSLDDPTMTLEFSLERRSFFDHEPQGGTVPRAVISRALAAPGELTQSLCSPWQNDYRECACFYWAANRPDFVNIETRPDGTADGNNWMQKDRTAATPPTYIVDDWADPRLITHIELFTDWEKLLRFVFDGKDEPALNKDEK